MPAPVDLLLTYADGTTASVHQMPALWERNARSARVTIATPKAVRSVALRGGIWVDADSTNDRWPRMP